MFRRVLIANRGEIAVRVIRCCREIGIEPVAVYSTADETALHVALAERAVCIGPPKAPASYLNMDAILTAAKLTGCEAIHPGHGFLSENPEFARRCQEAGLVFIGPSPEVMQAMGNKIQARQMMRRAGVPVVPGTEGSVAGVEDAVRAAKKIGFPLLIKAAAGGGGRGMRRAYSLEEVPEAFTAARAETIACFGDDEMYLERLIENPRHIEFQILADTHGHVIHLGERDCSIQRKNQKLFEESPAHGLTPELREAMGNAAVLAARTAGYTGAGTVEFVLDRSGSFYFIEMNTRIQVEHPVTELVTVVDLVREQLRIAAGLPLRLRQEDVRQQGHAMECRINAESPRRGFAPSTGTVDFLHMPGGNGVRVDSALYPGYETSPFYDSLLAKILVHAPTRLEALRRMRRALSEMVIDVAETNADLSFLLLHHPDIVRGSYDTGFLERELDTLLGWESDVEGGE